VKKSGVQNISWVKVKRKNPEVNLFGIKLALSLFAD
jgi:hypothetical protein